MFRMQRQLLGLSRYFCKNVSERVAEEKVKTDQKLRKFSFLDREVRQGEMWVYRLQLTGVPAEDVKVTDKGGQLVVSSNDNNFRTKAVTLPSGINSRAMKSYLTEDNYLVFEAPFQSQNTLRDLEERRSTLPQNAGQTQAEDTDHFGVDDNTGDNDDDSDEEDDKDLLCFVSVPTPIEPIDESAQIESVDEPAPTEHIDEPAVSEPVNEPVDEQVPIEPVDKQASIEPVDEPAPIKPIDKHPEIIEHDREPKNCYVESADMHGMKRDEIDSEAITTDISKAKSSAVEKCQSSSFPVKTDMFEIQCNLHKFPQENVQIRIKDQSLIIQAKLEEKDNGMEFMESLYRQYQLPPNIDIHNLECVRKRDGLVSISAPLQGVTSSPEIIVPIITQA